MLTLIAFAVALGVLITFHELGHYWVARLCGVRIERFSLGFGRVLWQRTDRHGTEWALSAIPLGGYVKMLHEAAPNASAAEQGVALNTKPLIQRCAIVLAGPVANLILAALLYAALGLMGDAQPAAILGEPPAHSPAARAGIAAGERVLAANDTPVQSWAELRWALLAPLTTGDAMALRVETPDGRVHTRHLHVPAIALAPDTPDPLLQAGLVLQAPAPHVRAITPGEAGARAGLRVGDVIVQAGDVVQPSASQVVEIIRAHPDTSVALTVLREAAPQHIHVIPVAPDGQSPARIGVTLGSDVPMIQVRYGLWDSLARGFTRTAETAAFSLRMMGRMLVGDVSVKNISGPVTIADYAGQTARVGLAAYLGFLALISVSIGILNLLPIPLLDGGHLLYYVFEAVRGKPLSARWQAIGQRIGAGLLAALMVLAFSNDLGRLLG